MFKDMPTLELDSKEELKEDLSIEQEEL